MNKRTTQKKQLQRRVELLERAASPSYPPGGGMMYVPAAQQQGILGQTFYGSKAGIPVGQSALFSPGLPLPPQPNVDPMGKPIQWRFPIAYNSFAVDRQLGDSERPPFEVLRRLPKMFSGCALTERYWLDLVPRMNLEVRLKKFYEDQGAEIKNFQKEQTGFLNFWEKPDGTHDQHTWLRMMLREQSQIDELYLYKDRTRGKKMLGYLITAGDQMKPLLDDWGRLPKAPNYAYQQYPWGIPGALYSTDMMIHYQESPAADSPFGFSRVERIILEVNQALRKKRKDLSNFTEGNIPQSFMEVPESLNWTPDQIDSYEQSWNALLAGNAQQQIRMKFLQPGMKYVAAEQYEMATDFDLFLFKIACAAYGVPVTEFGFTEDSNRSTGESQEDLVYRRTIGPIATSYARIMTQCMAEDFPPEMKGEMFEVVFTGYEEVEDEQKKATAITTYTNAGILGISDAAKLAGLPVDPDAVPIGRVVISQTNGPIFLDDIATPEMRKAQQQATLAGYQMAANPPDPNEPGNAPAGDKAGAKSPAKAKPQTKPPAKKSAPPEDKATMQRLAGLLSEVEDFLRVMRGQSPPLVSQQGSCTCEVCSRMAGQDVEEPPPYHDGCDCQAIPKGTEHVTRASPEAEDATRRDTRDGGHLGRTTRPDATRAARDGPDPAASAGLDSAQARAEDDARPKVTAASASSNGGNPLPTRSAWKLRW